MTRPLVVVRRIVQWSIPDSPYQVSHIVRVTAEPLVIDACGYVWTATGARDDMGHLLYQCRGNS